MVAFYRVIFFHFPPFDPISRFPFNLSPLISTRARPFETVLITSPRSSFLLVALFLSLRPLCSALSDYCGHGNTKGKKHPSSVFALFLSALQELLCLPSSSRCVASVTISGPYIRTIWMWQVVIFIVYIVHQYLWLRLITVDFYLSEPIGRQTLNCNISSSIFLNTYYFLLALTKRSFQ